MAMPGYQESAEDARIPGSMLLTSGSDLILGYLVVNRGS